MSEAPQTLRRFFSGMAEFTFQTHLGVADPPLIDYISDLLIRFINSNSIYRIRNVTGQRLYEVAQMMTEAEERIGDAKREVHRHVGDFTLFWTGVYPEALKKMRSTGSQDELVDYKEQGKRAYLIASQIQTDDQNASSDVLNRLSHQYDLCAYGLREVRRQWENDGDSGIKPFLIG
ncbi:MAG: hypothetical protein R3C28_23345 [Pirellulaceae bacterium]